MVELNGFKEFLELEQQRWKGFMSVFHTEPPQTGLTHRQEVWKKNKATLWYYPAPQKKYKIPLFMIYSLVNQPFILDLAPGMSTIESFLNEGYDVYLIDFGIPGYEDKDLTLNDYITDYIQKGVQKALKHSNADSVTIIGYCLGGTLAAMYAAVAEEPIKNLVVTVAPFDFSTFPVLDNWLKAVSSERINVNSLLETIGLVPAPLIEAGVRLITSPIYFSHYLSLLNRSFDDRYIERWRRFNSWTKSHIPFPSGALKQMAEDFIMENKLINGGIPIGTKKALLSNIQQNLLVISSQYDRLVPKELVYPIMEHVSSADKTYIALEGGHAGISLNGGVPDYLSDWLHARSEPL